MARIVLRYSSMPSSSSSVNLAIFNASSNGAILLDNELIEGDFRKRAFYKVGGSIESRDVNSTEKVTGKKIGAGEAVSVKAPWKYGPYETTEEAFKRRGRSVAGSIRKVLEWTELPQITEVSKSGGDQNTTQIQFLSDDRQRNLNTYKSAVSQTYSIAHDSTLPVYPLLRQLDEDEETVAAYMYVPKAKENRYWAATASFDDTPTTAVNEVETVSVVLNLQSPAMTFYKVTDAAA